VNVKQSSQDKARESVNVEQDFDDSEIAADMIIEQVPIIQ
jgi:hypothetical protein